MITTKKHIEFFKELSELLNKHDVKIDSYRNGCICFSWGRLRYDVETDNIMTYHKDLKNININQLQQNMREKNLRLPQLSKNLT